MPHPHSIPINAAGLGYAGNECRVSLVTPHAHSDVEMNFVTTGSFTYLVNGRARHIPHRTLHLFWAATPHVIVKQEPEARLIWVTIPLAWLMSWGISTEFTHALLGGGVFSEGDAGRADVDEWLVRSWIDNRKDREAMRIVMLEIEARIRRLVQGWAMQPKDDGGASGSRNVVEQLASHIAEHFDESRSIQDLASGAGVHPNYAMQAFVRSTGMTLLDYRTRIRVHTAQRLLISTDMTLSRIAVESGFGSDNRFYVAFRRICGCTPREYRRSLGGTKHGRPL